MTSVPQERFKPVRKLRFAPFHLHGPGGAAGGGGPSVGFSRDSVAGRRRGRFWKRGRMPFRDCRIRSRRQEVIGVDDDVAYRAHPEHNHRPAHSVGIRLSAREIRLGFVEFKLAQVLEYLRPLRRLPARHKDPEGAPSGPVITDRFVASEHFLIAGRPVAGVLEDQSAIVVRQPTVAVAVALSLSVVGVDQDRVGLVGRGDTALRRATPDLHDLGPREPRARCGVPVLSHATPPPSQPEP
ncbi:hypothetical protein [Glycomyces halotolerans]